MDFDRHPPKHEGSRPLAPEVDANALLAASGIPASTHSTSPKTTIAEYEPGAAETANRELHGEIEPKGPALNPRALG